MPDDPSTATDPIASLYSNDMACGVNGMKGVARVCSVNSGSTMTFEFRDWPDDASKGSIDSSHKGPCAVYLKKVDDAITDTAAGAGWFKLWDEGYDESAGKWCTEKLISNDGHLSVALPESLQGGYYLVRSELLALHNADKGDPQFYVDCAQIFLQSTGSSLPADTVSIPGYVKDGDASVTFNIWDEPMALPYPMPGPAVYDGAANGVSRVVQATLKQTEGLLSSSCVLTNANWCGTELAQYSTQDGCWNASAVCWDQCTDCYDKAPPTGSTNCKIWEDKCQAINDQCNAGNFKGPPNYMKVLTPAAKTIDVPAAEEAQDGDGSYLPATTAEAHSSSPTMASSKLASSRGASSQATSSSLRSTEVASSSSSAPMLPSDASTYTPDFDGSSTAVSTTFATSTSQYPVSPVAVTEYDIVTVAVTVYATHTAIAERSEQVSPDGSCGRGVTCVGSSFGQCCSPSGRCGNDCGPGCQLAYGQCSDSIDKRVVVDQPLPDGSSTLMAVSTDGSCGNSISCLASSFGDCCGISGNCGNDISHCGSGCQLGFGKCFLGLNRLDDETSILAPERVDIDTTASISTDGSCGNGFTCSDSVYGDCCGSDSVCGSTINACGWGCQLDFGKCFLGVNKRDLPGLDKGFVPNDSSDQPIADEDAQPINPRWADIHSHANWHKKFGQRRVRKSLSKREHDVAMME